MTELVKNEQITADERGNEANTLRLCCSAQSAPAVHASKRPAIWPFVLKRSGEFLQVDWGEVCDLMLTKAETEPQTRYFFAARLKYSRSMYVSFHTDIREETLLRCLIACFAEIDGVPWAAMIDAVKTAVLGRDEHHQSIWNPAYQKLAVEFKFHPDACAPTSGNQKGAVENLVKFVKSNFLPGRSFYDDLDRGEQYKHWLRQMNTECSLDATGEPPAVLLAQEQPQYGPLPT